jgi:hypothetical protein
MATNGTITPSTKSAPVNPATSTARKAIRLTVFTRPPPIDDQLKHIDYR